jgi:hypothetical protein
LLAPATGVDGAGAPSNTRVDREGLWGRARGKPGKVWGQSQILRIGRPAANGRAGLLYGPMGAVNIDGRWP